MIILYMGQPASGKTTLSEMLAYDLRQSGQLVIQLDGDVFRGMIGNNDYTSTGRLRTMDLIFQSTLALHSIYDVVLISTVAPYEQYRTAFIYCSDAYVVHLISKRTKGDRSVLDYETPQPSEVCGNLNTDVTIREAHLQAVELIYGQVIARHESVEVVRLWQRMSTRIHADGVRAGNYGQPIA